jgi:hypothetical protein
MSFSAALLLFGAIVMATCAAVAFLGLWAQRKLRRAAPANPGLEQYTPTRLARTGVAAFLCLSVPTALSAAETCFQAPGEHYDAGVAFHLGKRGIAHRFRVQSGVCVDERFASAVDDAMRELDGYYWKVSHFLADECEERAFLEWAKERSLRFDIGSVVDLGGRPAGRIFHLRSYTRDEMLANRRTLESSPKGTTCGPTSVG